MIQKSNRRPFATGSKPGPDELDRYLEEQGFYRKHVARDASSLFRVVSEQVLDIQNYHDKVRQDCASFMDAHIKDYSNEVDKNFYNYVSNLRRPRTYGTLLELRVMARMYKKNVILFEPNQNAQTTNRVYVQHEDYDEKNPIRVFYSQKDKHFDTIYTMDYVETLAECQSIVYDVLYTEIFKLPDVKYAVERMLHDQEEESTLPLPDDSSKFKTASGEIIAFDSSEETNCVLKDPKTCHFHNQVDFDEVVQENKDAITVINRSDDPGRLKIYKPIDGFLYKKDKSCVRQLLDEKITPFPYKVAKALDPSIYRNTEFELWSENRKEQRNKWLDSNGLPFKENDDKLWACMHDGRIPHYQMRKYGFEPQVIDETSYVTLEEDGKKKYYLVNPNEEFKFSHLTGLEHFQPCKESLDAIVMPVNVNHRNYRGGRRPRGGYHNQGGYHQDIDRDTSYQYVEQEYHQPQQAVYSEVPSYPYNYQLPFDQNSPPSMYQNQQYYPYQVAQPPAYQHPIQYSPPNYNPPMYASNFQVPPPTPVFPYPPPPINATNPTAPKENSDSLNLVRDAELSNTNVNWAPKESVEQNGGDLPMNDLATLQFYYNLGVRYFFAAGVQNRLESVANHDSSDQVQEQNTNDVKNDQPPPAVPANTPVTTKPSNTGNNNYPTGNRYHHNNRRGFNQNSRDNREGGSNNKEGKNRNHNYNNNNNNNNNSNQRKEIQFNPNVKNLHKAESNLKQTNSSLQSGISNLSIQGPNASSSSQNHALEKTSTMLSTAPSSLNQNISHISPISPPGVEIHPYTVDQNHMPQYYQPQILHQHTPSIFYYQADNGELVQVQQQPMFYTYPQPPQTPIYYPAPMHHSQSTIDTFNSSDSGLVDVHGNYHAAAAYPFVYPAPQQQFYYPSTPLIQTPHITSQGPVFPTATPIVQHHVSVATPQHSSGPMVEQTVSGLSAITSGISAETSTASNNNAN